MGADESFESLVQLTNTSKPIKLVCSKYKQFYSACLLGGSIRFLFEIAHENLARPLAFIIEFFF
jgi:hypothetical protein